MWDKLPPTVITSMKNLIGIHVNRAIISDVQHLWILSNLYHRYPGLSVEFGSQVVM